MKSFSYLLKAWEANNRHKMTQFNFWLVWFESLGIIWLTWFKSIPLSLTSRLTCRQRERFSSLHIMCSCCTFFNDVPIYPLYFSIVHWCIADEAISETLSLRVNCRTTYGFWITSISNYKFILIYWLYNKTLYELYCEGVPYGSNSCL